MWLCCLAFNFFCFLGIFRSSKKSGKGKRPGKGGNRFWKSIGLGFKTPREAIEGSVIWPFIYMYTYQSQMLVFVGVAFYYFSS